MNPSKISALGRIILVVLGLAFVFISKILGKW